MERPIVSTFKTGATVKQVSAGPNRSHVSHKDLHGKIPGQSSQKRCVRYNFKCGEFPRLSSSPYNVDTQHKEKIV